MTNYTIYGLLWGLISIPIVSRIKDSDSTSTKTMLNLLGLPAYLALKGGAQFNYIYIGAPLVGAGIGYTTGKVLN